MSFICTECTTSNIIVEFPTLKELDAHIKGGHMNLPEIIEKAQKKEDLPKPELKPIVLNYKFTGNCPECNSEVETIMINLGEKLVACAVCPFCKVQRMTKEVVSLEEITIPQLKGRK